MMMTPVRSSRRKRVSISPKKPKFKSRISDPDPQTPINVSSSQPALLEVEFDFPFSYFDEYNKCFTTLNRTQSVQLLQVLRLHFSEVLSIMPVAPFLIIECDKAVPDPATTPFLVAGLIACFVIQGSSYPFGIEFIGRDGGADGLTENRVPMAVWRDIQPFHIPNLETFRWIHQNIKLATHVSSFPQQLVIELRKMTDQQFEEVLETLPDTIGL